MLLIITMTLIIVVILYIYIYIYLFGGRRLRLRGGRRALPPLPGGGEVHVAAPARAPAAVGARRAGRAGRPHLGSFEDVFD